METEIKPKEQPLFKITTIKKKHAEQIRVDYITDAVHDFSQYDILGFISSWHAVLVRKQDTGHFSVFPLTKYADWLMKTEGLDGTTAYRRGQTLPQLFLD
jgi:hypothetical protein